MSKRRVDDSAIDAKLAELGIDMAVSPDEAVLGQTDVNPYNPLDGEDDEEEHEEEDLEVRAPPAPSVGHARSPLRDALFEQQLKPVSVPAASPTYIPDVSVAVAPPRPKKQKLDISPAAKRMGSFLAKRMPGAERIRIERRKDNEQLAFIGEFRDADLAAYPDVESFIFHRLKPKFGPGSYKVTGIDAAGNRIDAGELAFEDPIPQTQQDQATGMFGFVKEMMEKQLAEQQMAMNPVDTMKGLLDITKSMQPAAPAKEEGSGNALVAMISAQGQQTQAFMQMMMQQSQQQMQLMLAAMAPKEDPVMKTLLAKLVEDRSSGSSMPLPPPPPPPNPMEGFKEMFAILATVMDNKKGGGFENEVKDLLKDLIKSKDAERIGPRDMITLMKELQSAPQENRGSEDFRKSMENMGMMLNVVQSLRGQSEASPVAGFWDALGQLFSNRDFAGSIAAGIRAKAEASQIEQRKQLINAQAQAIRSVQQNRQGPPAAVIPIRANQQMMPPPMPASAPPPAPMPVQAPEVAHHTSVPPPPVAEGPKFRLPQLPVNTPDHINGLIEAPDDAQLMQRTISMLIYFFEFPEWKPFIQNAIVLVQQGEKQKAAQFLAEMFSAFMAIGLLGRETVVKVLNAFVENFEVIQNSLASLHIDQDEETSVNPIEEVLAADNDEDEEDEEEDDDVSGAETESA